MLRDCGRKENALYFSTSLFNNFNGTLFLLCEQGGPHFLFHQAPQIVSGPVQAIIC